MSVVGSQDTGKFCRGLLLAHDSSLIALKIECEQLMEILPAPSNSCLVMCGVRQGRKRQRSEWV